MSKENIQIVAAVVFVFLLIFYFPRVITEDTVIPEPETAVEPVTEDSAEKAAAPPAAKGEGDVTESDSQDEEDKTPDFLDSFDEGVLGKESDDIQSGLDLLNNPLQ